MMPVASDGVDLSRPGAAAAGGLMWSCGPRVSYGIHCLGDCVQAGIVRLSMTVEAESVAAQHNHLRTEGRQMTTQL